MASAQPERRRRGAVDRPPPSGVGTPQRTMANASRSGNVLQVDEDGYLVNPCRPDLIQPPWLHAVEAVRAACLQHFATRLHSLYVRGSVATGRAVPGLSDIDMIAVINADPRPDDWSWTSRLGHDLGALYPFHTGIEIALVPLQRISAADGPRASCFLLATQSVCVWGEDLTPALPRFRPGPDSALHAHHIGRDVRRVARLLAGAAAPREVGTWCRWIMKRLVRSGFELVMEEERTYTRDLEECYAAFARHFPAYSQQMRHALAWAVRPSADREEILRFLSTFGAWLCAEATVRFGNRTT